jgi:hypothetical protein
MIAKMLYAGTGSIESWWFMNNYHNIQLKQTELNRLKDKANNWIDYSKGEIALIIICLCVTVWTN